MIRSILAGLACLLALVGAAPAGNVAPDDAQRFIFKPVQDGFVRLDTRNGQVALCSRHGVGFACEAAPEERAALEDEIARLEGENATMKKALLTHGLDLPSGIRRDSPQQRAAAASPPTKSAHPDLRLPGGVDLDRVMAFLGRAWHRLVELVASLQHHA